MGVPISLALWLFDPELSRDWILVLASPIVATQGMQPLFRKIREAREALGEVGELIRSFSLRVMDPDRELAKKFRTGMQPVPGIARIRFKGGHVVAGHYIDDALVYRNAA